MFYFVLCCVGTSDPPARPRPARGGWGWWGGGRGTTTSFLALFVPQSTSGSAHTERAHTRVSDVIRHVCNNTCVAVHREMPRPPLPLTTSCLPRLATRRTTQGGDARGGAEMTQCVRFLALGNLNGCVRLVHSSLTLLTES